MLENPVQHSPWDLSDIGIICDCQCHCHLFSISELQMFVTSAQNIWFYWLCRTHCHICELTFLACAFLTPFLISERDAFVWVSSVWWNNEEDVRVQCRAIIWYGKYYLASLEFMSWSLSIDENATCLPCWAFMSLHCLMHDSAFKKIHLTSLVACCHLYCIKYSFNCIIH